LPDESRTIKYKLKLLQHRTILTTNNYFIILNYNGFTFPEPEILVLISGWPR